MRRLKNRPLVYVICTSNASFVVGASASAKGAVVGLLGFSKCWSWCHLKPSLLSDGREKLMPFVKNCETGEFCVFIWGGHLRY
jgi:hypothetical protein